MYNEHKYDIAICFISEVRDCSASVETLQTLAFKYILDILANIFSIMPDDASAIPMAESYCYYWGKKSLLGFETIHLAKVWKVLHDLYTWGFLYYCHSEWENHLVFHNLWINCTIFVHQWVISSCVLNFIGSGFIWVKKKVRLKHDKLS